MSFATCNPQDQITQHDCAVVRSPEPILDAGISVIMPAYNEAEGVGATLETLQSLLAELGPLLIGSEIIVVDDGSVDGTVAAVEPFLGRGMQLVRHA